MLRQWTLKRVLTRLARFIGYTCLVIVVLLILVALAIQIPAVQNRIVSRAVTFVSKRIGTPVHLDRISITFPKTIVLRGLYFEDQKADTLLYVGRLTLNTDLWALTRNTFEVNDLKIDDATISVQQSADSTFNFDYIIEAFASSDSIPDSTSESKPWLFNIEDISLRQINARYLDSIQSIEARIVLGQLNVAFNAFDLSGPNIEIDQFRLESTQATLVNWAATDPAKSEAPPQNNSDPDSAAFNLSFDELILNDVTADYRQLATAQHAHIDLGNLQIKANEVSLPGKVIDLTSVALSDAFIAYQSLGPADSVSRSEGIHPETADVGNDTTVLSVNIPWKISVGEISFANNNVQYYKAGAVSTPGAIDFNHVWLRGLNFHASDIYAFHQDARASLNNLAFSERSGFVLTQLSGKIAIGNNKASIRDLLFTTPHSRIGLTVDADNLSLSNLNHYDNVAIDLNLDPGIISGADVLFMVPALRHNPTLAISDQTRARITTKISGTTNDLTIRQFHVNILDSTVVSFQGVVKDALRENPGFTISLDQFYTTARDLRTVLPDSLLPEGIAIPHWVSLKGDVKGRANDPSADLFVSTNLGNATLKASLSELNKTTPRYTGSLEIDNFDVGKLLMQSETMGTLTTVVNAEGSGFTPETIDARLEAVINEFEYQGYPYRDLKIDGTFAHQQLRAIASLADSNLIFNLKASLDQSREVPVYAVNLDIKNADFAALHLTDRPLSLRGILTAEISTPDFSSINGTVDIRKFGVYNGKALYMVDSLLFASIDREGESAISIRSDIVSGDFGGTINITGIADALKRHFNNYFTLDNVPPLTTNAAQKFKFNLVIKDTDLLTEVLIPELGSFVPGTIEGAFDSEQKKLDLRASITGIRYGNLGLDSVTVNVASDSRSLDYTVGLRKIVYDTVRIEALRLTGKVASDSIRTKFLILDTLLKEKYLLGGAFYSQQDELQFRLLKSQVKLNYAPWQTPSDNYLRITKKGLLAHNFSVSTNDEGIALVTREEQDARTAIEFRNFDIKNLTRMVEARTLAGGFLNGDFMLSGQGRFKTALSINKLQVLGIDWGDLQLDLEHQTSGRYQVDMGLDGANMALAAKGTYQSDSVASQMNLALDINRIGLQAIAPLTGGQLSDASGQLDGELTLKGAPTAPEIRGHLAFKEASITPSFVNTRFLLKNERINFTADGISIERFKVLDPRNNVAELNGMLRTKDYSTFNMDLRLSARQFQVLNTKEGENDLFYGKVGINTTANISGTFSHPVVNMEISMNDDSQLTYVVPASEKGVLDQKGIVTFVDRDAENDPFLKEVEQRDTVKASFTGIDLTANIELDDKEQLSIVIDPLTGDKLTVKGNSTLTLNITPSGNMQLSGRYEITDGSYDFTFYKLVKRNFKIVKGSSITWFGDPMDATLDLRASYRVETSPAELFSGQITDQAAIYKQRLPFLVYLNIDGELLTPEISFELDMPEDRQGALAGAPYAKIKDINTREADLNKQVFALLILQRFVADDVFDNQGGSSVAATARRSVSKLLTDQLNRMSQNIKGLELSFDVRSDEDYSSGEAQAQTQVQLGVSKTLLDDRLVVKVSGNVDIEGNRTSQGSLSDYIGDLALEYKLTEDGRFRVTGFRNSNYDIISGELIETGAGLIYIKDYDALKELFKANDKSK